MHQQLEKIFKQSGNRLTQPRIAIFQALADNEQPLTIAEIGKSCPAIDRTSIYRTLELFVALQIVALVPHGWKHKYELAEPFKPHHHHFHCESCGTVLSLASDGIEELTSAIASKHGFIAKTHTFEIRGLCSTCAATD